MAAVSLQQGIQALKQGDIPTGIEILECLCQDPETHGPTRWQAQAWLVRAYLKGRQEPKAQALCQQLTQADNPKMRQWATEMLTQIPAAPAPAAPPETPAVVPVAEVPSTVTDGMADPLSDHITPQSLTEPLASEAAEQLLEAGIKELRRRNYAAAIATLEAFMGGTDESYPNYAWGRTSLAKAYKGSEQYDAAMGLCQTMLESDRESTRAWARDFIKTLPKDLINPVLGEPTSSAPDAGSVSQGSLAMDAPVARPSQRAGTKTRSRSPVGISKAAPADLTPQILSGLAHGSVSLLASLLLFMLFSDSILANILGLVRMAVPIVILKRTQDPVAKANAKEATNYVMTAIAWLVFLAIGRIFIALGIIALGMIFWPFLLLIGLLILVYNLAFCFWPIYAAIVTARQPERVVRYPSWLVWHLL
ncbi:MAG: tetratricopeptide repeat protein [Cyanobacteria bacterium]|nr:tetratricopeptide repeat protein [Cyanobacteriota bacterium]MDA0867241.1 tetratricopeptide repeat protein [Cyanobacteriota bacterium]